MTKRIFISFIVVVASIFTAKAQDVPEHAIGLRLSESDGFWAEASYQAGLNSDSRIELDLGVQGRNRFNALKLTGMYHWVFNIDGGLNWYVGPGIGGGLVDFDNDLDNRDDLETFGFVTGDVGVEYHFDFPLLISIDFRPEIYFDDLTDDDIIFNLGVSARYKF
ncbi:hypothetical protein [Aquimarina litoralis]|uniref:hypothetical protein n=1 Tax=Aquimarina litoralis TaxID=584605 RepID=UPI001C599158|nr:hypothetical protein [Aquimarina litoralis]MBW1296065.1 hypothetical protein [Aquimarina litoralis]